MHYGSDDTTFLYFSTHRINSNIDQYAQNFANCFIASLHFLSILFHENRPSTAANIVQIQTSGCSSVMPSLSATAIKVIFFDITQI